MDGIRRRVGWRAMGVLAAVVLILAAVAYSGGLMNLRPASGSARAMSYAADKPVQPAPAPR